jgi:uncharacterized phage infection (PIP) family protein YhgE
MEMDYELLNLPAGESDEQSQIESSEKETPIAQQETPEETSTDRETREEKVEQFDYENLTPREKFLLERLEKVTGENLSNKPLQQTTQQTEQQQPEIQEHSYLSDTDDVDEVLSTRDGLNKLLNQVHQRAMQQASHVAAERILRSLPETVSQYVTQHMRMAEAVKTFYDTNPDLTQVKRTVAQVANEVAAEKPEFTHEQVFAETATRVRRMLQITDKTQSRQKPAFAGQRGRTRANEGGNELSSIAKEIQELIEM